MFFSCFSSSCVSPIVLFAVFVRLLGYLIILLFSIYSFISSSWHALPVCSAPSHPIPLSPPSRIPPSPSVVAWHIPNLKEIVSKRRGHKVIHSVNSCNSIQSTTGSAEGGTLSADGKTGSVEDTTGSVECYNQLGRKEGIMEWNERGSE